MKRFLKKANRGLLLGAFALILLVIYIVVDYVSFNNEKPKIKETIENYIGEYYDILATNDYVALEQYVKDSWTSEPVMTTGYYEGKEDVLSSFDSLKETPPSSEYGDISYDIEKLSIKKTGPNMAYVKVNYDVVLEYGYCDDIMIPLSTYWLYWADEYADDKRYIYEISYEYDIYLRKEDGEWKISQTDGWPVDSFRTEKEGE